MLAPGTVIGPFKVVAHLGSGGMGDVYRARDSRLGREVALKVLPADLATDPDRLARFRREAQILAALNHPNIAAIHGLEESNGIVALVLELVEGPTLADRIADGPMPIAESLATARQLVEALDAAHERGIVHRDLKPANIKVRTDGAVKVLDFGLAKAIEAPTVGTSTRPSLTNSPTMTSPALMTGAGMILGTAAYMAPEQARGKAVDKRADIWALGAVLFEMVTAHRAFPGEEVADTLARVLEREPDWSLLPSATPSGVRALLRRCLERDPRKRLRDVGDAHDMLNAVEVRETTQEAPAARAWSRTATAAALGLLLGGGLASVAWIEGRAPSLPPKAMRFTIHPPAGTQFSPASAPAVSPDGSRIAFVAVGRDGKTSLWVRPLDAVAATPLPGTEDAKQPFWSPDSTALGFFSQGRLKKLTLAGGLPQVLCDAPNPAGGTWGADDVIVFAPESGTGVPLLRVSANGGTPTAIGTLRADRREANQAWPAFMPDGRRFVFFEHRNPGPSAVSYKSPQDDGLQTLALPDGFRAQRTPRYWVYGRGGSLVAVKADSGTDQIAGEEMSIASGVAMMPGAASIAIGAAQFSASSTTTLAYLNAGTPSGLFVVDRSGMTQRTIGLTDQVYSAPTISPDGSRIAFVSSGDIWVEDLDRPRRTRLSDDGASSDPLWSPDGQRLLYASHPTQVDRFLEKSLSDGAVRQWAVDVGAAGFGRPQAWLADGRVLYSSRSPSTLTDIWMADPSDARKSFPLLNSRFNERSAAISPDSRWLAYTSDETGRQEVWVRRMDGSSRPEMLTHEGGQYIRWGRHSKEVFWITLDGVLMAAPVRSLDPLDIGEATPLFQTHIATAGRGAWDVFPDGQRFVIQQAGDRPLDEMTVIVNWQSLLKQ